MEYRPLSMYIGPRITIVYGQSVTPKVVLDLATEVLKRYKELPGQRETLVSTTPFKQEGLAGFEFNIMQQNPGEGYVQLTYVFRPEELEESEAMRLFIEPSQKNARTLPLAENHKLVRAINDTVISTNPILGLVRPRFA